MKDSILDAIGTPLVRVASPEGATVAAKVESFNPGGSAKDRPARAMVEAAERAGDIEPGDRLVEATSGNTGIGLAVVAAARGYDLTIVMPASMSEERRRLLRAYGADLELVEGEMQTANARADQIAAEADAFLIGQFKNPANPRSHYETTAEEILDQVDGREIDAFVAGVGTGGTITGTATRLLEEFPDMEVVAVEPTENAVLSTGKSGNDRFQGMGPGFVSDILDVDLIDTIETVDIDTAEAECRRLARDEGILVGQSSGAASIVARRVAERIAQPELNCPDVELPEMFDNPGDPPELRSDGGRDLDDHRPSSDGGPDGYDDCPLVVTVFPDSGERYLTAGTFD
ncbi:PLP-dependent cysteine synthase family protein [Halocalculus aciditolerans]|uniref:Cysteine synthase n=1 Tax=Halocalculus aciditolerans TaxID=1383812 RepID=A0A830F9S9_9EURY|nr:PLP-dependent cysteine synthase family protein [Halocalculus aciditolerans]GGL53761.1 cysteine synthase [Halocalculus aciditolerans]